MRLSAVSFLMILTTIFLSGCGRDDMATLDDHGTSFYGHNGVSMLASAGGVTGTFQAVPAIGVSSNDLSAPGKSNNAGVAQQNGTPFARGASPYAQTAGNSSWQWPVNGQVTEKFGPKANGISSEGIVIAAPPGSLIKAAQAGEVAFVGNDAKNYGNIVILRHANGEMTSYSHASSIIVKKGEQVAAGKVLGYVGQTGNAKEPQLHFAVREGSQSIDPLTKLPQQVASK